MFNSFVLTWERNFEVTFGIFSVLVFQVSLDSTLRSIGQHPNHCAVVHCGETLAIIANRCPVHGSPQRKFQERPACVFIPL